MSVMEISIKEFSDIATTIKNVNELNRSFYNHDEEFMKLYHQTQGITTDKHKAILCFIERLYIANRLAYSYQYNEEINIKRLDESDLSGRPLSLKEFMHTMSSIEYNIYTNGGNSFLSEKDMERLKRLINITKDLLLYLR